MVKRHIMIKYRLYRLGRNDRFCSKRLVDLADLTDSIAQGKREETQGKREES